MLLSDIFAQLTYGELADIRIGGKEFGAIQIKDYPEMLVHLQLALSALHRRFQLRTGLVIIEQELGIAKYVIDISNSVSNAGVNTYLKDSVGNPYLSDILKIERVMDSTSCDFYLNDASEETSLFTPNQNTIQVPIPKAGVIMAIEYRANHPTVVIATTPAAVTIDLPIAYLEALTAFIAYRIFTSLPRLDGQNIGREFLDKYEYSCSVIEKQGTTLTDNDSTDHAGESGWV